MEFLLLDPFLCPAAKILLILVTHLSKNCPFPIRVSESLAKKAILNKRYVILVNKTTLKQGNHFRSLSMQTFRDCFTKKKKHINFQRLLQFNTKSRH